MRRMLIALVCLGLTVGPAGDLAAQGLKPVSLGGQVSWGDEADFGIGGRIQAAFPETQFVFIGSFDLFFPDDVGDVDIDYWEVNGNLAYHFDLLGAPLIHPYIGAGLNFAHITAESVSLDGPSIDRSDDEFGLNLLGGTWIDLAAVRPFIEARVEIEGGEQFVITGGILF